MPGLISLALASAAVPLCAVTAEDDAVPLPPLRVQATRLDPGQFDAGAAISLRQDWTLPDVWDSVESAPDVYVARPGGLGGNPTLSIRGAESNHTKVLVDGVEVGNLNDSRGSSYGLSALAPLAVQSVDVIPGPQSSVYGSDAMGGVLRIRTLPNGLDDPAAASRNVLQADVAGRAAYGAAVEAARRLGDDAWLHAVGDRRVEEGWVEGPSFAAPRLAVGGLARIGGDATLAASAFGARVERTTFPDDSGGPRLSVLRELDRVEAREAGVNLAVDAPAWETARVNAQVAYYRLSEDFVSPGVAPGERDPIGIPANTHEDLLERLVTSLFVRQDLGETFQVIAGTEWRDEQGESESTLSFMGMEIPGLYEQRVQTLSGFAEARWKPAAGHELDVSVRCDDPEDLDAEWTGQLAWTSELTALQSTARLSWGRGFKRPSFFALSSPTVGNPSLKPEHAESFDLTLVTSLVDGALRLRNSLYRQRFSDMIDLAEGPPPHLVNLGEVISKGVTSALTWTAAEGLELGGHVAWNDIEDVASPAILRQRPEWRLGADLAWRFAEGWTLRAAADWTDERRDSSVPTGPLDLEAYLCVDLSLSWQVTEALQAALSVENVMHEDYEEAIGFPAIGRRTRLGLRYEF